ncbi:unnamed protein product [Ceratitis capitata]|uniref:(Mediterranean fruit fly) hypothetical protein n=1 Tax=Ceratitis capitata TaxID=7213 RepID=A0A811UUV5_CERCA|nr:unnamed protein product [Ceratitis capitata]
MHALMSSRTHVICWICSAIGPQVSYSNANTTTVVTTHNNSSNNNSSPQASLKATTSGATANDNGSSIASTNDVATKQPIPVTTTTNPTETIEARMVSMEVTGGGIGTVPTSRELLCAVIGGGGGGGVVANEVACGEISGNPKTPTASAGVTAETSFYTNVIGNCNGRKNNGNPSNDNNATTTTTTIIIITTIAMSIQKR